MKELNIVERKKELNESLENFNYCFSNPYLICKLIKASNIDKLLSKITDVTTKINSTAIIKKKKISGSEQFLIMLDDFIYRFKEDFHFLNRSADYIIELSLQRDKYTKYLLSKNYIGNNDFIPYFNYNYKRLIVYGFYYNLKVLAKYSDIIKDFAINNNIDIKKNLLNKQKDLNILYNLLKKISCCNVKEFNNILLFESIDEYINAIKKNYCGNIQKLETSNLSFYLIQWEYMIENYYKKIDAVNILFDQL